MEILTIEIQNYIINFVNIKLNKYIIKIYSCQ